MGAAAEAGVNQAQGFSGWPSQAVQGSQRRGDGVDGAEMLADPCSLYCTSGCISTVRSLDRESDGGHCQCLAPEPPGPWGLKDPVAGRPHHEEKRRDMMDSSVLLVTLADRDIGRARTRAEESKEEASRRVKPVLTFTKSRNKHLTFQVENY